MVIAAMKLKAFAPWEKKFMTKLGRILKSTDIIMLIEIYIVSYGFSSSHVWMGKLDHKEG